MIRKAEQKDIGRIIELLSQVLEIHARIRPDVFVPGTTKYTAGQIAQILENVKTPVYVAEENGEVAGYAFCAIREPSGAENLVPHRTLFIDDLCVDEKMRGAGIGESLFVFVKEEARRLGCDVVGLAVWEGNDPARRFYERMGMTPRETFMELFI
ncbi:MAG: GNAT family N-acetyltransferase [Clostridia bacterium]|nr:GNAT family N-acetyltransferase [Clostridia bacterium]MBR7032881.1 GNAT family N-acetyltransferase [Clostridia bacterium]